MCRENVVQHLLHPLDVGRFENADGFGQAQGAAGCPDDLAYVWIRFSTGRIVEVRHRTKGCPVAIAASSVICELAKGRTLSHSVASGPQAVLDALGDVPKRKADSVVAPLALQRTVTQYQQSEDIKSH